MKLRKTSPSYPFKASDGTGGNLLREHSVNKIVCLSNALRPL